MAVTDADIKGWLNANPGADDKLIAKTMREAEVTPERMAKVTGLDYGDVASRYEKAIAPTSKNNDDQGIPSLLDELKSQYTKKGATTRREEETEAGIKYYDDPVQLGSGWTAWENQPQIIGYQGDGMDAQPIFGEIDPDKKLGGFARSEGNKNYFYDTNGKLVHVEKQTTDWDNLGPIIMGAVTMGGGAGTLGSYLFPSLGATAAAGAGGALAGGFNAAMTDQDILQGALKGGVSSAGAMKLGDTGFTLGDVNKAINFAQNPNLAGAANLFTPSIGGTQIGDTGISLGDVFKGVGTAQDLSSGDYNKMFKAITGLAGDQGKSLKSSLAGFDINPDDFIEGYFKPGGEGYMDLNGQEMTVRQEPENLDAFLRELSPYALDGGKSVFAQDEDIPEFETVDKRPVRSLENILGVPDILQPVEEDIEELTITDKRPEADLSGLRTKEIKSDIPDELTIDDIDKLFPDLDINDILQTVPTTVTPTKPVIPTPKVVPEKKTTQQALIDLGLGAPMPSQDPYANIKLMEELFGGDTAYKLRSLGAPRDSASSDMDALARLLRNQNA
jgi:hypothetical protein